MKYLGEGGDIQAIVNNAKPPGVATDLLQGNIFKKKTFEKSKGLQINKGFALGGGMGGAKSMAGRSIISGATQKTKTMSRAGSHKSRAQADNVLAEMEIEQIVSFIEERESLMKDGQKARQQ